MSADSPVIKLLGGAGLGSLVFAFWFVIQTDVKADQAKDNSSKALEQVSEIRSDIAEIRTNDAVQTSQLKMIDSQLKEIKSILKGAR